MAEPAHGSVRMVLVLVLIAACCAAVLSVTHALTRGPIERAEQAEISRALVKVLPPFENNLNLPENQVIFTDEGILRTCYVAREARDSGSRVVGVGIRGVSPEGYGGDIHVLVGILPDGTVHGVEVLQHSETPGLGSNVRKPSFLDQFRTRRLRDAAFRWAVRADDGSVDAMTSATITSRAATNAIVDALRVFDRQEVQAALRGTSAGLEDRLREEGSQ